jgi:hypothetical protein
LPASARPTPKPDATRVTGAARNPRETHPARPKIPPLIPPAGLGRFTPIVNQQKETNMKTILALLAAIVVLSGCATTPQISADLQPIDSSAIKALGYDEASQTLFVQMLSTMEVYTYQNVPGDVYQALMDSESKGSFYAQNIKGKYTSGK